MGPIFNEKIDKNEICGSMNSTRMHCSLEKVNILRLLFMHCSLNSSRIPPKTRENKTKKKRERKYENATPLNADAISAIQTSTRSSMIFF